MESIKNDEFNKKCLDIDYRVFLLFDKKNKIKFQN